MVSSIVVFRTLTRCALLHSVGDLKAAAEKNVQCSLIRTLMLCGSYKNISSVTGGG